MTHDILSTYMSVSTPTSIACHIIWLRNGGAALSHISVGSLLVFFSCLMSFPFPSSCLLVCQVNPAYRLSHEAAVLLTALAREKASALANTMLQHAETIAPPLSGRVSPVSLVYRDTSYTYMLITL